MCDLPYLGWVKSSRRRCQMRRRDQGVFSIRPGQVRIGVHDELTELKNHFSGVVHSLLYHGDVSVYRVKLADGVMIEVLLPNSAPGRAKLFEVGDAVKVDWRHDAGMFLHG
jgi:spermidine/putrescine transport system ATP-binding protein